MIQSARLVSVTSLDWRTPEESIVYMARVTSPRQEEGGGELKLLHYLVKNGHWSPFDMVDMIIEIRTTRAIMAQILRHWSFRFQEFSQRYATVEAFDFSNIEARMKSIGGNRQGSGEVDEDMSVQIMESCAIAAADYQGLVDAGVAPECARFALPLATPTRAYMKGSVRSWMTYFWQRLDPHAQKEHREIAAMCFQHFRDQFPNIAELVSRYKPQVIEMKGWMSTDG